MAGTFVLVGADETLRKFATTEERLRNPQQLLDAVGELIVASVERNFEEGGRPNKWRLLSASTLYQQHRGTKWKKRGGQTAGFTRFVGGKKILINIGTLKDSITARVEGDSVKVGTSVIYGAIHQFGGLTGRGHKVMMPARPFLMLQEEDWTEIRAIGRKFFFENAS